MVSMHDPAQSSHANCVVVFGFVESLLIFASPLLRKLRCKAEAVGTLARPGRNSFANLLGSRPLVRIGSPCDRCSYGLTTGADIDEDLFSSESDGVGDEAHGPMDKQEDRRWGGTPPQFCN